MWSNLRIEKPFEELVWLCIVFHEVIHMVRGNGFAASRSLKILLCILLVGRKRTVLLFTVKYLSSLRQLSMFIDLLVPKGDVKMGHHCKKKNASLRLLHGHGVVPSGMLLCKYLPTSSSALSGLMIFSKMVVHHVLIASSKGQMQNPAEASCQRIGQMLAFWPVKIPWLK